MLLLAKNLILPGIRNLQLWFIAPFRVMSTRPGTYYLDLPPSLAAFYPWFHTSPFEPARPQPPRLPALVDNSYEVEAILQINKFRTHAKVAWVGYDSSQNQYIWLSDL